MNAVELIAENFYLFREYYSGIPGGHIHRDGEVTMINTGIPYPGWNAIVSKKPALHSIEMKITEYISHFQLPCCWWIGPEPGQRDLGKILENNGFIAGGTTAAMALELEGSDLESLLVSEIKILPVSNILELEQYLWVLRRSFHMPLYAIEALYSLFSQNFLHENVKIYHYIGISRGKAVGCATLFLTPGAAGIYYVGVLPGMRGGGIGKMMTIHCLKMAREMNYRISVLRASNLGEGIYRQLGYKKYGHFHHYCLNPDRLKNYIWKMNYYFRYLKDKFTGDAIWFS